MESDKRFKADCERHKEGNSLLLTGNAVSGKFIALAEVHSHMELWHKRLGHMNQKGLSRLCNLKKLDA